MSGTSFFMCSAVSEHAEFQSACSGIGLWAKFFGLICSMGRSKVQLQSQFELTVSSALPAPFFVKDLLAKMAC